MRKVERREEREKALEQEKKTSGDDPRTEVGVLQTDQVATC